MEVEKITVKVECGPWAVHAVAILTDRKGRTKEGGAGAAAGLCRELQVAPRLRNCEYHTGLTIIQDSSSTTISGLPTRS